MKTIPKRKQVSVMENRERTVCIFPFLFLPYLDQSISPLLDREMGQLIHLLLGFDLQGKYFKSPFIDGGLKVFAGFEKEEDIISEIRGISDINIIQDTINSLMSVTKNSFNYIINILEYPILDGSRDYFIGFSNVNNSFIINHISLRHKNSILHIYKEYYNKGHNILVFNPDVFNKQELNNLSEEYIRYIAIRNNNDDIRKIKRIPLKFMKKPGLEEIFVYEETLLLLDEISRDFSIRQMAFKGDIQPGIVQTNDYLLKPQDILEIYRNYISKKAEIHSYLESMEGKRKYYQDLLKIKLDEDLYLMVFVHANNAFNRLFMDIKDISGKELSKIHLPRKGRIRIKDDTIEIFIRQCSYSSIILKTLEKHKDIVYKHLGNRKISFKFY